MAGSRFGAMSYRKPVAMIKANGLLKHFASRKRPADPRSNRGVPIAKQKLYIVLERKSSRGKGGKDREKSI